MSFFLFFLYGIINFITNSDLTGINPQVCELPALIQCVIDEGKKVKTFLICDRYTNINNPEDIPLAEKLLKK